MAEDDRYFAASQDLLQRAQEALDEGDLVQASEKGWGATAQIVKAVAERKGWAHGDYRDLAKAVNRLAEETEDLPFAMLFYGAYNLHFYQDMLPKGMVELGLDQARRLIHRLESP